MGVIELINTIILVVGITFGVMLVAKLVISTLAEESRKNEDHAMKLMDKFFDRLKVDMFDIFRGIKKIEDGENEPVEKENDIEKHIKQKIEEKFEEKYKI